MFALLPIFFVWSYVNTVNAVVLKSSSLIEKTSQDKRLVDQDLALHPEADVLHVGLGRKQHISENLIGHTVDDSVTTLNNDHNEIEVTLTNKPIDDHNEIEMTLTNRKDPNDKPKDKAKKPIDDHNEIEVKTGNTAGSIEEGHTEVKIEPVPTTNPSSENKTSTKPHKLTDQDIWADAPKPPGGMNPGNAFLIILGATCFCSCLLGVYTHYSNDE